MGVISIVTGDYKPTYNWGGTTLHGKVFPSPGALSADWAEEARGLDAKKNRHLQMFVQCQYYPLVI